MRSRSGSSASTNSNKELSADNLPIYVNISDGKTIKLNVRPVHTVSNVLEFLSASTTLPNDVRLVHDGKPLDLSSTVADLKLQGSVTLQLDPPTRRSATPPLSPESSNLMTAVLEAKSAVPSSSGPSRTLTPPRTASSTPRTGTPSTTSRKSNKPRCSKTGCKAPIQPIVGDCGFCQKRFCGKHRMLESHACEGLEDARQADKDRNAAKLEGERTIMLRGLN